MSYKFIDQAFKMSSKYSTANLIYRDLSYVAETLRTDTITITQNEISDRCGPGRSTVRDALRYLETKGFIQIIRKNGNATNQYRIIKHDNSEN